ncbi:MAG: tRNA (guanosine(46)-N7)-methyltransferase TrmB [Verrucomicrobiota bacterium]
MSEPAATPIVASPRARPTPPSASLIYRPASYVERLKPEEMFPETRPLEVELGSGDGSFLAQYAQLHPERNFIAVERLLGRLRKLDRKGRRAALANLRLLRIEASYFTEYLLPPGGVQAIHVYFPDPWPKRRHHKNRLVNTPFTGAVARALAPQGVIYLRTDNEEYFAQMTEVFARNQAFELVETPEELSRVITDFERDFNAEGIPTRRAAYRKRV